jgi:hypothetical protein
MSEGESSKGVFGSTSVRGKIWAQSYREVVKRSEEERIASQPLPDEVRTEIINGQVVQVKVYKAKPTNGPTPVRGRTF